MGTYSRLEMQKEDSLNTTLATIRRAKFRILAYSHQHSTVLVNYSTWRIIFTRDNIRRLEFGDAYDSIPHRAQQEFISDFAREFSSTPIVGENSHFCRILAEKCF